MKVLEELVCAFLINGAEYEEEIMCYKIYWGTYVSGYYVLWSINQSN